jgi:hypothetical protein
VISDAAFTALEQEAARRSNSKAVLAAALRLYQENYLAARKANPNLTRVNAEALLLMPTSIASLLDQSEREFNSTARAALLPERIGKSFGDAVLSIVLNIISSILFVVISIGVYLSMQDTAKNLFQSFGLDVRTVSEEVERKESVTHVADSTSTKGPAPASVKPPGASF